MIDITEEKYNELFDKVDETINKAIEDLPEPVRSKAAEILCLVDKYTPEKNWHMLGCYMKSDGPIIIYVGQIFEDCHKDIKETMKSVRQVYYHELGHALGGLAEYELKERGL